MEKKRLMCIVFTLFVVFFLFGIFNPAAASEKQITLSLSHFFPPTHFVNTIMVANWVKDVEEATRGAVKINVFPGATLLKPAETYDGVISGTADMAVWVPAYTRGRFPVLDAFEIPGILFGSCTATTAVAIDGIAEFKPKELSDTKVMFMYSVGPGSLYSKKKVPSLADLKGMRIRATGSTVNSIKALGAVPVAMPMNDAYEALSKGVVEGNIGPPEILKGWKQAEVTKYITILPPVYNSLQGCTMNLNKWKSLPADVKKAIEKVNENWSLKAGQIWDAQMKENGIDYGIKEHGMEIVRWSEADFNKAMELMQPLLDDYVDQANKKGLPGKEIIAFSKERAAKYSKMYPAGY
ncbi:MAG: TRAP transporter substrate-binding protein [Desulfobacterales bacterium]|nr:TRAP transporter substrate-binding protein [Desulfobacterales bacterium]